MTEPFVGEIRTFGFSFAPRGWAMCAGQLLPINQNQALFSLLGTMYGGDGITTFGLPDLRGRVAVGLGQGPGLSSYTQGELTGTETVPLTLNQMPAHLHTVNANAGSATATRPEGAVLARAPANTYAASPDGTAMNQGTISPAGGSQPHPNLQPLLVLNPCIALEGIFPSRS